MKCVMGQRGPQPVDVGYALGHEGMAVRGDEPPRAVDLLDTEIIAGLGRAK